MIPDYFCWLEVFLFLLSDGCYTLLQTIDLGTLDVYQISQLHIHPMCIILGCF